MNSTVDISQLHSIRSAARRCKVAPGTVRNWILTNRLKAERSNNRVYIEQSELDAVHKKVVAERKAKAANKVK